MLAREGTQWAINSYDNGLKYSWCEENTSNKVRGRLKEELAELEARHFPIKGDIY